MIQIQGVIKQYDFALLMYTSPSYPLTLSQLQRMSFHGVWILYSAWKSHLGLLLSCPQQLAGTPHLDTHCPPQRQIPLPCPHGGDDHYNITYIGIKD